MITVLDVMRSMGVEITSSLSWSVGVRVRELYEARTGCLPEKALRTKTIGTGSHCFAVYPDVMRDDIERVVRAHATEATRQLQLL
jgi:hypothetical protein